MKQVFFSRFFFIKMVYFRNCSKCPPSFWIQNSSLRLTSALISMSTSFSLIVRAASNIRSISCSLVWMTSAYTRPFMYPQRKKSKGVRSGLRAGHGIGPFRPIHGAAKVRDRNWRTAMVEWGGAPSCWKIIICRTSSGTSARRTGRSCSRNSRYFWAFNVPSKMCGPIKCRPMIPAQTLTENFRWLWVSFTTLGFSIAHVCSLWQLNTPSRVNVASSDQRMMSSTRALSRSWPWR